jgi:hypothetical protein
MSASGAKTILLVEDEPLLRMDLADELRRLGFAVVEASRADVPVAGGARGDDVAVAVGRASRRRGEVAVQQGELHQAVEQPQRHVVGDVLLRVANLWSRRIAISVARNTCSIDIGPTAIGRSRQVIRGQWHFRKDQHGGRQDHQPKRTPSPHC